MVNSLLLQLFYNSVLEQHSEYRGIAEICLPNYSNSPIRGNVFAESDHFINRFQAV